MSNEAYHEIRMALPEHVRAQVPPLSSLRQDRKKQNEEHNYYSRGIHFSWALIITAFGLKTLTFDIETLRFLKTTFFKKNIQHYIIANQKVKFH